MKKKNPARLNALRKFLNTDAKKSIAKENRAERVRIAERDAHYDKYFKK